jgi:hypothetical protein
MNEQNEKRFILVQTRPNKLKHPMNSAANHTWAGKLSEILVFKTEEEAAAAKNAIPASERESWSVLEVYIKDGLPELPIDVTRWEPW